MIECKECRRLITKEEADENCGLCERCWDGIRLRLREAGKLVLQAAQEGRGEAVATDLPIMANKLFLSITEENIIALKFSLLLEPDQPKVRAWLDGLYERRARRIARITELAQQVLGS